MIGSLPGWMDSAICAQIGGHGWDAIPQHRQVEICATCPVVSECGQWGVDHMQIAHKNAVIVHGGMLPQQLIDTKNARKVA